MANQCSLYMIPDQKDYVLEKDLSISGPDLVDCVEAVDPTWFEDNEDLRIKILTEGRP